MAYGLLISEVARAALDGQDEAVRARLERALTGLAELAEVAPPIDASWRMLAAGAPPLMRTEVGSLRVLYDLDPVERTLRVLDVQPERG